MLAFLSPAKNMESAALADLKLSAPRFPEKTETLARVLKAYSPWQLEGLMKINPELALKAFGYYQDYGPGGASAALLSYRGLAYSYLNAADFTLDDFAYAETHLRLFSAFYGPLRPSDAIRPYRLEMQCALKIDGKNLYRFWADTFYKDVFRTGDPVINLASAEYAKTVTAHLRPGDTLITCSFLVRRRGKYVCLPTAAKMARGGMARYMVKNRLQTPEQLKDFSQDGFEFQDALSTSVSYVFLQA